MLANLTVASDVNRILVIGDGMSLAHVGRALVVADELRTRGHDVVFATSERYHRFAVDRGFAPESVYCVDPALALKKIRRGGHIFNPATLNRYVASDRALLQKIRPDLVIADMRLSLNISAQVEDTPHQHIVNAYLTRYCAVHERPPRTFPVTRLLRGPLEGLYPAVKAQTLKYYGANFVKLRKKHGLPATVTDIFDVIDSPHGNWIADDLAFMPCTPKLPSRFTYIGPVIWEPQLPADQYPAWWPEAQQRTDLVYVTMGSTGSAKAMSRILRELQAAGRQAVATLGSLKLKDTHGALTCPFLPGSAILPHCNLVISHGGSGTLYQAMAQNVPVLCVPTFHDQEINAERLESLGLGKIITQINRLSDSIRSFGLRAGQAPPRSLAA